MTCKEIMTADPTCCVPGDSAASAAQIMKREDVGPVLVVSDHNERRLVGIVTDRDLALHVVAEGRDPHAARVDEVMTRNPVTCTGNDEATAAMDLMAEHQVRRIPIVDSNGRLQGIVAQADVARSVDEEQVGRVVEDISEPYGSSDWDDNRRFRSGWSGGSSLAMGALCMGLGASLMYVLDPTRGTTRRRRIQDKGHSLYSTSEKVVGRAARDVRNRASGMVAEAESHWKPAEVPDDKLVARVRSKIGHHVSNSSAIEVTADDGKVALSGPILASQVRGVLDAVNAVPGVRSVESRLDVHETPGSNPSLQGARNPRANQGSGEWSPGARLLAGVAGGTLLICGMRSKGTAGAACTTIGSGLLTCGLTNREFSGFGDAARRLAGV